LIKAGRCRDLIGGEQANACNMQFKGVADVEVHYEEKKERQNLPR